MSRQIILVTVGNQDWAPTDAELKKLKKTFEDALSVPNPTAVVSVRTGVEVNVITVDQDNSLVAEHSADPKVTVSVKAAKKMDKATKKIAEQAGKKAGKAILKQIDDESAKKPKKSRK